MKTPFAVAVAILSLCGIARADNISPVQHGSFTSYLIHENQLFLDDVSLMTAGGNVLTSGGFEGGLSPWYQTSFASGVCTVDPQFCTSWNVVSDNFHDGSFSAFVSGSKILQQDFSPVSTNSILSFTYWGSPVLLFEDTNLILGGAFLFSDGTFKHFAGSEVLFNGPGWQQFDGLAFLPPDKELVGIQFFGTDPVVEYVPASEPDGLLLLTLGLVGLFAFRKGWKAKPLPTPPISK